MKLHNDAHLDYLIESTNHTISLFSLLFTLLFLCVDGCVCLSVCLCVVSTCLSVSMYVFMCISPRVWHSIDYLSHHIERRNITQQRPQHHRVQAGNEPIMSNIEKWGCF